MSASHIDTAVIGAGAAGLITGRLLAERGREFAIFDDHARVGDAWRERYRSLRLFTASRLAALKGLRMDLGRFEYPTAAQLADHLEEYARHFALPVHSGRRVTRLTHEGGRFTLAFADGRVVTADRVIVAAGAHHLPVTPSLAAQLDPAMRQVHSIDYRGPDDLSPGPVLVVGAANSGTDIALEAAAAGHPTTLAGRHPGQVPIDIDTWFGNLLSGVFLRRLAATTWDTPRGRAFFAEHGGHGVNLVRNKIKDLDAAGIRRVGRVTGVVGGVPQLEDGSTVSASTVVWCTGSLPRLDWIDVPGVFAPDGRRGWPVQHERGVATQVAGLGFVGLPVQHSAASATLIGIPPDAEHVVERLLAVRSDAPALVR
ncbi:MAG TPA: NAD(P)/FAD-dependent oxidoreductase [Microbacterium sp.]|nr:NAD(P)/FAD-dependent oxidoreductase [Microbacterium sp.]